MASIWLESYAFGKIVDSYYQLWLTGSAFTKTVLLIGQNVMLFEMFHDVTLHRVFRNFTADRSDWDWMVIGWVGPIAFLKHMYDVGLFPVSYTLLVLNLGTLMLEKSERNKK